MTAPPDPPSPGEPPHAHLLCGRMVTAVMRSPLTRVLRRHLRGGAPIEPRLEAAESHGALIRWARGYDPLVRVAFGGRESRVRAELLDSLALHRGDRVLDVACGTGTLAAAAVDAVVTTLAWHHIPPDAQAAALAEMTRVLRPGGRLLIADFQVPASPMTRRLATHVLGHRMSGNQADAVADQVAMAGLVELRRGTTSARWLAFVTARKPARDAAPTPAA